MRDHRAWRESNPWRSDSPAGSGHSPHKDPSPYVKCGRDLQYGTGHLPAAARSMSITPPTPRRFRENLKPGINLPVCGRAAGRLCRLNPSPPNPSAPVRFRLAKQNALAVDRALVPPTAHKAHLRALHLALHNHARARQTSTQERSNRNRIGDCDPGGGPSRGLILRACRAESLNSGWIFEMCRMTSGGAPLQLPALSRERRIFCGGEPG